MAATGCLQVGQGGVCRRAAYRGTCVWRTHQGLHSRGDGSLGPCVLHCIATDDSSPQLGRGLLCGSMQKQHLFRWMAAHRWMTWLPLKLCLDGHHLGLASQHALSAIDPACGVYWSNTVAAGGVSRVLPEHRRLHKP